MIPKIIHQTWKDDRLPENLQHWHTLVRQLHPGWEIKLWTDEENLQLVKSHFPGLLDIYQTVPYNIMRVDIVRYLYMAVHGGFYLDLDYEVFESFDSVSTTTDLLLPIARASANETVLGNCIFGSVPGDIFWQDVVKDLLHNPPVNKFYNKHNILKLTGPEFLSRIYFGAPEKYNALLSPPDVYHPPSALIKSPSYKEELSRNGSKGIHHCEGSWLPTQNPLVYVASKWQSFKLKLASRKLNRPQSNIN